MQSLESIPAVSFIHKNGIALFEGIGWLRCRKQSPSSTWLENARKGVRARGRGMGDKRKMGYCKRDSRRRTGRWICSLGGLEHDIIIEGEQRLETTSKSSEK